MEYWSIWRYAETCLYYLILRYYIALSSLISQNRISTFIISRYTSHLFMSTGGLLLSLSLQLRNTPDIAIFSIAKFSWHCNWYIYRRSPLQPYLLYLSSALSQASLNNISLIYGYIVPHQVRIQVVRSRSHSAYFISYWKVVIKSNIQSKKYQSVNLYATDVIHHLLICESL